MFDCMELLNVYQVVDGHAVPRDGAVAYLYELLKEREQEATINISHYKLPTFKSHGKFVESLPYVHWYLIVNEGVWVGYISATHRNEIGVILAKAHRGKGFGPMAIQQFIAKHEPLFAMPSERSGHWLANINPENHHSQHVFEKLGFKKIQSTYALIPEEEARGKGKEASSKG